MIISKRHLHEVIRQGKEEYILRLAKFLQVETEGREAKDIADEIFGQLNWGLGTRMLEMLMDEDTKEKRK